MDRRARFLQEGVLVFCAVALSGALALTQDVAAASQDPQQPDSYNSASRVPAEKPAKSALTAADRAMTQKIRKAIAEDKSISVEGRHVKITTQDGKVTLAGVVRSEAERTSIFTKAADAAGGTNVVNNLTVPPQK